MKIEINIELMKKIYGDEIEEIILNKKCEIRAKPAKTVPKISPHTSHR